MGRLLAGFRAQLRRIVLERRFRIVLLLLAGLSCVSAGIYRHQVLASLPVAVVDLDNSMLSRRVRMLLGSMREIQVAGEYVGSPQDAERLMTDGDLVAVVVIPSDFASSIKRGASGEIVAAVDMSNILVGKNAQKAIARAVGAVGAGVQLTTVQKLGVRGARALPAVVPVTVDENFSFNPAASYSVYIVPGLVFFLLHVYAIVLGTSLGLPGQAPRGMAERAGAGVATWLVCMLIGAAMLWGLLPWAEIHPATGAPLLLALLAGLVVADLLLVAAAFSIVPGSLTALEVTVAVALLSLMLSGITWPADMFPGPLRIVSEWLPFTPFARGLRSLIHYETSAQDAWPWLAALGRQSALYALLAGAGALVRQAVAWVRQRRLA